MIHRVGPTFSYVDWVAVRATPSTRAWLRAFMCVVWLLFRMRCGRFHVCRSLYVRWWRKRVFSLKQRWPD